VPERPGPAHTGDEPYVFVSYAHEDAGLVLPEIAWLEAHGVRVWWDEGITPGAVSWRAELAGAIRDSAVLLYFVTPRSVRSEHCVREVGVALDESMTARSSPSISSQRRCPRRLCWRCRGARQSSVTS